MSMPSTSAGLSEFARDLREVRLVRNAEEIIDGIRQNRRKRKKEFDFKRLDAYIEDNESVIDSVYIGFAEDWSCSDLYWRRGRRKLNRLPLSSSSWATPTAEIIFMDGEIIHFSCYREERKFRAGKLKGLLVEVFPILFPVALTSAICLLAYLNK